MTRYPKTLKACLEHDGVRWKIGKALLTEVGPPSSIGINDGSTEKLEDVKTDLSKNGIEYSVNTLTRCRIVAFAYRDALRLAQAYSFDVCDRAGDPVTLQAIIDSLPEGTKITRKEVDKYLHETARSKLGTNFTVLVLRSSEQIISTRKIIEKVREGLPECELDTNGEDLMSFRELLINLRKEAATLCTELQETVKTKRLGGCGEERCSTEELVA